jgi:phosphatidylethanolamine/phosphatidyl-N-methylethanolamine N-methyltransferase
VVSEEERQVVEPQRRRRAEPPVRIEDEARFLKSWVERPLVMGALTPSGKLLARTMASYLDPARSGPVIELGPGTGPVTEAIIRRGFAPERLILVEFNRDFCRLLRRRFPKATVIEGDAYRLADTLKGVVNGKAAAVTSSLPLLTKPLPIRMRLLDEALALVHHGAPFVQFTYAVVPPIPKNSYRYAVTASNRIWLNLPPARVWVYRQP